MMSVLDTLSDISSSETDSIPSPKSLENLTLPQRTGSIALKRIKCRQRKKRKNVPPFDDPQLLKYWNRRYDLFERFDSGIKLDNESWFGVTPECIARRQASICAGDVVIDAFAGVGGNSIQFAGTCGLVLSIEHNWSRLRLLQHNASVYGVSSRIMPVCGDVENVLRSLRISPSTVQLEATVPGAPPESTDAGDQPIAPTSPQTDTHPRCMFDTIFMSPPWGGPGYTGVVLPPGSSSWNTRKRRKWFLTSSNSVEPIKNLEDLPGFYLALDAARHTGSRMVFYLPRSSSIGQVLSLGWPSKSCQCTVCTTYQPVTIEEYILRGRRVAIGAYVGDFTLETE